MPQIYIFYEFVMQIKNDSFFEYSFWQQKKATTDSFLVENLKNDYSPRRKILA